MYVSYVSLVKHILEHFTLARHCACYSCRDFLNFYGFDRAFLKKKFFFSARVLMNIAGGREVMTQSLMGGEEEFGWLALVRSILDRGMMAASRKAS